MFVETFITPRVSGRFARVASGAVHLYTIVMRKFYWLAVSVWSYETRLPSNSICLIEQLSIISSYPSGRNDSSHSFPKSDFIDSKSFHTEINIKSFSSEDKFSPKKYPRLPGLPFTTETEVSESFCLSNSAFPGLARTSKIRNMDFFSFILSLSHCLSHNAQISGMVSKHRRKYSMAENYFCCTSNLILRGFAWWLPCVWWPFIELWEIVINCMPLSPGSCENM